MRQYEADLPSPRSATRKRFCIANSGVEAAPRALANPRALWAILRTLVPVTRETIAKRRLAANLSPQGGRLGLPADFLIAPDGRVRGREVRRTCPTINGAWMRCWRWRAPRRRAIVRPHPVRVADQDIAVLERAVGQSLVEQIGGGAPRGFRLRMIGFVVRHEMEADQVQTVIDRRGVIALSQLVRIVDQVDARRSGQATTAPALQPP